MAFSTEFVMGAGGGGDVVEVAVAPITNVGDRTNRATFEIGPGEWLMAPTGITTLYSFSSPRFWLNGTASLISTGYNESNTQRMTVTGPTTVVIDSQDVATLGGLYMVKIG